jgi:hypothetical protein
MQAGAERTKVLEVEVLLSARAKECQHEPLRTIPATNVIISTSAFIAENHN